MPQFLDFVVGAKPQRIMWGCVGSRQSRRPPAQGRWWPNIAMIGDARKREQPAKQPASTSTAALSTSTSTKEEQQPRSYAFPRTQSALRTVLVLVIVLAAPRAPRSCAAINSRSIVRRDRCGTSRKTTRPVTASEYEYRCTEYEHEHEHEYEYEYEHEYERKTTASMP